MSFHPDHGAQPASWEKDVAELLAGYLATDYCVFADDPFVLRIGARSDALGLLYQPPYLSSATFITAYNPYSQPVTPIVNEAAQAKLQRELLNRTPLVLQGEGRARAGDWPGEPSFLALGLIFEDACALGTAFHQNAILFANADAIPRLVVLR